MSANLQFSLSRVSPAFIMIGLGFFLRRLGVIDKEFVTKANRFVFLVALPVSLFSSIARTDVSRLINLKVVLFAVAATAMSFGLVFLAGDRFLSKKELVGTFVQGAARSNIALIGTPLVMSFAGRDAMARMAVLIAFTVPLYNMLSVIVVSFRNYETIKPDFRGILKKIITNPLIIGILCGIPFYAFQISFPYFIDTTLTYFENMTTPLALLIIGGSFQTKGFIGRLKPVLWASLIKTALLPFFFLPVAFMLGIRGTDLLTLYILFGSPAAVSSYANAVNLKGDGPLASGIIVVSTVLSVFTLTLGFSLYLLLPPWVS